MFDGSVKQKPSKPKIVILMGRTWYMLGFEVLPRTSELCCTTHSAVGTSDKFQISRN